MTNVEEKEKQSGKKNLTVYRTKPKNRRALQQMQFPSNAFKQPIQTQTDDMLNLYISELFHAVQTRN